ncbi:MAG TPA: YggT family protein [Gaiellaceae bacterium]|nr:YggT family protein [Gaiellaceae bacterium]
MPQLARDAVSVGTPRRAANTHPMGADAIFALLADTASSLQSFVSVFVGIYVLLIFAYVLLSWVQLPYSGVAASVQRFLDEVCRPYLGLFRGRIPTLGPLDLSPIVAVVVLLVAAGLVNRLIGALL